VAGWIEGQVDRLQVDVIVTVAMIVIVEVIVVVTVGLHLYFRVAIWGKERGL
jgi:hypothetical protein